MANPDSLGAEHFAELPVFALAVTTARSDWSQGSAGLTFFLVAFVLTDSGLQVGADRDRFVLGSGTINFKLFSL